MAKGLQKGLDTSLWNQCEHVPVSLCVCLDVHVGFYGQVWLWTCLGISGCRCVCTFVSVYVCVCGHVCLFCTAIFVAKLTVMTLTTFTTVPWTPSYPHFTQVKGKSKNAWVIGLRTTNCFLREQTIILQSSVLHFYFICIISITSRSPGGRRKISREHGAAEEDWPAVLRQTCLNKVVFPIKAVNYIWKHSLS